MNTSFDVQRFEENKQRNLAARKMLRVPQSVQQFFTELLLFNGKRSDYYRTCITCKYWNKEQQRCILFNALPPAEVIADGCNSYVDFDEVPF